MRMMGIIDQTKVNGPGLRTGCWSQGCTVSCSGCSNLSSWDKKGGYEEDNDKIVARIIQNKKSFGITGYTFSGGEPLEQPDDLFYILSKIQQLEPDLDVLLFSGRLISEIRNPEILNVVDIFIDGPYIESQRTLSLLWRGSLNQKVYFLNDRIKDRMKNFYKLMDKNGNLLDEETGAELTIGLDGEVQLTGFSDFTERKLKNELR